MRPSDLILIKSSMSVPEQVIHTFRTGHKYMLTVSGIWAMDAGMILFNVLYITIYLQANLVKRIVTHRLRCVYTHHHRR